MERNSLRIRTSIAALPSRRAIGEYEDRRARCETMPEQVCRPRPRGSNLPGISILAFRIGGIVHSVALFRILATESCSNTMLWRLGGKISGVVRDRSDT